MFFAGFYVDCLDRYDARTLRYVVVIHVLD
jgi:hypothetical protein